MNELIEKSNSIKFYEDADLRLESMYYKPNQNLLELSLSINQISYDVPIEYEEWKITCEDTINFRGFKNKILLPYVKIELLEKHPLLRQYQQSETDFWIIGKPINLKEFYGELAIFLERKCGNWIKLNDLFWNLEDFFLENKPKYIKLSDFMVKPMQEICKKHKVSFKTGERKLIKEFNDKADYKLLIFGNKDISPNSYNLNQHYVIAKNFNFHRLK